MKYIIFKIKRNIYLYFKNDFNSKLYIKKMASEIQKNPVKDLAICIQSVEEHLNNIIKEKEEQSKIIKTQQEKIIKLKTNLKIEQIKSAFLTNLIEQKTDIKVDELFKIDSDGVHMYHFSDGNIPIVNHNDNSTEEKVVHVVRERKKAYRSVKNKIEIDPEIQEERIKQIEEKIYKETKVVLDISENDTLKQIQNCFEEIAKNRIYKKNIDELRQSRNKLLGKYPIEKYTQLINDNIKQLQTILTTKNQDTKKILLNVNNSLSSIDKRLIYFDKYYDSQLEIDEIQQYKLALKIHIGHAQRPIPFSLTDVTKKLFNYSMAVFNLKQNLKRALVNKYECYNICFLNLTQSDNDDKFRFYTLEKTGLKNNWKIEYRLYELSLLLGSQLKTYCINLFRKLYFDVFKDNLYRENYREQCPLTQTECQVLFNNLILVCKQKRFCNLLRDIVSTKCCIKPTNIDTFNLTTDDRVQKAHYHKLKDNKSDVIDMVKRLFDNIEESDITDLLMSTNDFSDTSREDTSD
jgi:hypothetical protein